MDHRRSGVARRAEDRMGPGYRVYFGETARAYRAVVLLTYGTKRRQQRDVGAARACWHDYKARTRGAATSLPGVVPSRRSALPASTSSVGWGLMSHCDKRWERPGHPTDASRCLPSTTFEACRRSSAKSPSGATLTNSHAWSSPKARSCWSLGQARKPDRC